MIEGYLNYLSSLNSDVIIWLNQFSQMSASFNKAVDYVQMSPLIKGIPSMGLLWYFWFRDVDNSGRTRRLIVAAIMGCLFALIFARVLNNVITHPRPIAMPLLHLQQLSGLTAIDLEDKFYLHSFPSDHATMFFSLVTAIFLISRRAGIFAFAYVSILICLPRMYMGLHFPADILGGALLGIFFVLLCTSQPVSRLFQYPIRLLQTHPAAFQAALFMLSVEMCVMFDHVRPLVKRLFGDFG